tara:strand:+ start:997 stop:1809 length:813 start_codon:yes stop_codon:yes gene_type:complete
VGLLVIVWKTKKKMDAIEAVHAALSTVAKNQGCTSSILVGTVSRHTLPSTASFSNVSALHSKAHASATSIVVLQRTLLATSESSLVFSARFENPSTDAATTAGVEPKPLSSDPALTTSNGKRKRNLCEDQEEAVTKARKRLSSVNAPELESELEMAQAVIERVLTLRGPAGEVLVQSYALLTKKLKPSDAMPSVVIAIRLNSGIPVHVSSLKRCLGTCWKDGVVSSSNSVNGVCDRDLPLTEEGEASKRMGNLPMLIVTSIPKPSKYECP